MRAALLAVAAVALAGCTSPGPSDAPQPSAAGTAEFREIPVCEGARAPEAFEQVVQNADEWQVLWARLCDPAFMTAPPPAPSIDFGNHTILAVGWGEKPNTGHVLEVIRAFRWESHLGVAVARTAPGAGCVVFHATTYPLLVVEVARAPEVRAGYEDRTLDCDSDLVEVEAGPWRFQFPPVVSTTPGVPARYALHVFPSPSAGIGQLVPEGWVRLKGSGEALNLSRAGGTFDVEALPGAPSAGLRLAFERTELAPEDTDRFYGHAVVRGPAVHVVGTPVGTASAVDRRDHSPLREGVHARASNGALHVTYSMGPMGDDYCAEAAASLGFQAWSGKNATRVVGIVSTGSSDACEARNALLPPPARTPRVEATLRGLPPGPVEVVVYTHQSCFCAPTGGWTEHRTTVDLR